MSTENKKYVLIKDDTVTTPSGKTLYRIKALVAIGDSVSPRDLGGYIEAEKNLSVYGDAWVFSDALVLKRTDIQWFYGVGSEGGTLTVFRQKDGSIYAVSGCFAGTLDKFKERVREKHGDSRYGRHYEMLIQSIEFWFSDDSEDAE